MIAAKPYALHVGANRHRAAVRDEMRCRYPLIRPMARREGMLAGDDQFVDGLASTPHTAWTITPGNDSQAAKSALPAMQDE
ncbi:hypothetical protein [Micromonospora avicenniae]|uniref:hypothetical protein n=1 Tax=Micromonospora avicenniae TaxID=1198245 RepID=UPI001FEC17C7|nr:hypothetical protein [Micromonospora avicenniae]